jgi:hypothetical protein
MKRIFIACIFILSCKNKKSELIDLQRMYTDSMMRYEEESQSFLHNARNYPNNVANEMLMKSTNLEEISKHFRKLVDSIGWELKKY